jgi:hypothetical protein
MGNEPQGLIHATGHPLLTSIQDLDSNFMSLRRGNVDLLDLEFFAGCPANGGFAVNSFACGL